MKRALLAAALLCSLAACGPLGSLNPVGAKTSQDVSLQPSEAKGLQHCSVSGTIDQLLAKLKKDSPSSYDSTNQQWTTLKSEGATDAHVEVYAKDTAACSALNGLSTRTAPSSTVIINLVVHFKDATSAKNAYTNGAFGISPGQAAFSGSGAKVGASSGLGPNSVVAYVSQAGFQVYVGLWQHDQWLAYVVCEGFSEADGTSFSKAVDSRM